MKPPSQVIDTTPKRLSKISEELGVSVRTLKEEGIPCYPLGNRLVVCPIALLNWSAAKRESWARASEAAKGKRRRQTPKNRVREVAPHQKGKREVVFHSIVSDESGSSKSAV